MKDDNKDKSIAYLHVLNRLAHTTFLNEKYSEADKYFQIAKQLSDQVQTSDLQKYYAQRNIVLFLIHTDLKRAKDLTLSLYQDDKLPHSSKKELKLLLGTISTLSGDYKTARSHYRETLRDSSSAQVKAISLNNFAMTNFFEYQETLRLCGGDRTKMLVQYPDLMKDESYTFSYLKQSILAFERDHLSGQKVDFKAQDELERFLENNTVVVPPDHADEQKYLSMFKTQKATIPL